MKNNFFKIQTPEEVKSLSCSELSELSQTLKQDIIQHTSTNGGHIGASLGCVDMVVALHKVFETPKDSIVFDVGHQAYAHKMLTGRRHHFYTLRKENGISGFPAPSESQHDAFGTGHASTAISAALGILEGKKQNEKDDHVIAVVGDGALTGGLSFEGLNHTGWLKKNLIIVLNDNKMSIDSNVGGLKESFDENKGARDFFGSLGIDYWGPFDGHNIRNMVEVFRKVKNQSKPTVVHLLTKKGNGYKPAMEEQTRFHGCGPFVIESGKAINSPGAKKKYQDFFSETLIEMACADEKMVAITAAMPTGTSLNKFNKVHPERFYDVGLAESHALTFAAGLAAEDIKPFTCIYSTFLQRSYDQIMHDVALQNLPVRICMDRGGLVGDDGATHQGVFDYAYLRHMPNFVVMAPKDEVEMQRMMETMRLHDSGPISMRFPRGEVEGVPLPKELKPIEIGKAEHLYGNLSGDVLICAIGNSVNDAVKAAIVLEHEYKLDVSVINLRFAKPLDEKMILDFAANYKALVTVEEGVVQGGVGTAILELLAKHMVLKPAQILGVEDMFVAHATQARQREVCGIDQKSIQNACLSIVQKAEDINQEQTIPRMDRVPLKIVASQR